MNACVRAGLGLEGNSRRCFAGSPGERQQSGRRSCTGGGDGCRSLSRSPPGVRSLSGGCKSRGEARSGCERCSSPPGCRGGGGREGRAALGGAQVRAADGHPAPGLGPGIALVPRKSVPCAAEEPGQSGDPKRGIQPEQEGGRRPRRAPALRPPGLGLQREKTSVVPREKLRQQLPVSFLLTRRWRGGK